MKKKEVLLRLGAMAMIAALGIAPVTSGMRRIVISDL